MLWQQQNTDASNAETANNDQQENQALNTNTAQCFDPIEKFLV